MADYDSIPTAGTHRGPEPADPGTGTEVRAPRSDDETAGEQAATFQLVHVPADARYHLRPYRDGASVSEGHREVGRYRAEDVPGALATVGDSFYVVLENAQTGEMRLTQESDLTANWTDGGRFDRITLFERESDAAEYVASRQG